MEPIEEIKQILLDNIVTKECLDSDFELVDDIVEKVKAHIFEKTKISHETRLTPNAYLWIWHSGRKYPELCVYREDVKCFYRLAESDYMFNELDIPYHTATHYMLINRPRDERNF